MRLGSSDAGSDPAGSTTRKAYDLLAKGFGPGYNGPLQLVAQVDEPAQQAAFTKVTAAVAKTSGVVRVTAPKVIAGAAGKPGVATADVYPIGSPQDASTTNLLHHLRNQVVPASSSSGLHVLIGGQTAIFDDFSTRAEQQAAAVHRRRRAALVPAAHGGVPQPADPADGRGDEPAHRRRVVRRDHGRLPVGLGGEPVRDRQDRADRGVRPGDDVRDRVRPLDGLPGVPRHAASTRNGTAEATTARPSPTASPPPDGRSPRPPRSWCSSSARSSSAASG